MSPSYNGDGAAAVGRAALCAIAPGSITSNPARRLVLPSRARRSHTHSQGCDSCRFGDSFRSSGIGRRRPPAGRRSSRGLRRQRRFHYLACTSRVRVPQRDLGLMRRAVRWRPSRQPRSVVSSASSSSPCLRRTLDQSLPPTVVPRAPLAIARANKGFDRVSWEHCGSTPHRMFRRT